VHQSSKIPVSKGIDTALLVEKLRTAEEISPVEGFPTLRTKKKTQGRFARRTFRERIPGRVLGGSGAFSANSENAQNVFIQNILNYSPAPDSYTDNYSSGTKLSGSFASTIVGGSHANLSFGNRNYLVQEIWDRVGSFCPLSH
jgi:hypothetical protein